MTDTTDKTAAGAPRKLFSRNLVLMWQGTAESNLGKALYSIAIGVWVYNQTGSTALMGTMTSITYFAAMVLQPLGGVLADRLNKRNLMAGTDAVCGVGMLWLAWYALQGRMQVWQVLAIAGVTAVCNALFNPASSTLLPQLVSRENYTRAASLLQGTNATINFIGNSAGGFLVAWVGVPWLVLANGVMYLFSALTECFIRPPKTEAAHVPLRPGSILRDMAAGAGYTHRRGLTGLILAGAAVNLTCGGFSGIVYVWCLQKGMTVGQYGLFLGAESVAAIAATLLLAAWRAPARLRYPTMLVSVAAQSVFYLAAMLAKGFWPCTVLFLINAFFNSISNIFLNTALVQSTEPAYQGRVLALFSALCCGGIALSMVLYGGLAEIFGVVPVALVGAALTIPPTVMFAFHPAMRRTLEGD